MTTLAHHIDVDFLLEAWRLLRKDAAPGIDGVEALDYAQNLRGNLEALLHRFKSGLYRAPPVRRVYIPKGDGSKTRPLGIPTVEDRILQKAVAMVLEAVYEQDFLDCSYGFRPGRSAHDALEALWQYEVRRIWQKWLARRGGKRALTWERFTRMSRRFPLAPVRVVHSAMK